MASSASRLARITFDMNGAGHHVLGDANTGIAFHDDVRQLVHATAVIADVPVDLDGDGFVETACNGMLAVGMIDNPMSLVGVRRQLMQSRVQFAQRLGGKIECRHQARSQA